MIKTVFIIILCILIITVLISIVISQYITKRNDKNFKSLLRYHKELPEIDSYKIDLPIFYINMDEHVDRKEFISQQLISVKNVVRVPGVLVNDEIYSEYDTKLSKPELGCLLAHMNALKTFLKTNYEKVIIIEDDASFKLSFFWDKPLSEIDDNVFYLGFGTSAYIVSRERAKYILDKFNESRSIRLPVDLWYKKLFQNNNRKDLIYQYNISLPSTIRNGSTSYCINQAVKIINGFKN